MPIQFDSTTLVLKNEHQEIGIELANAITNGINWVSREYPTLFAFALLFILVLQWIKG